MPKLPALSGVKMIKILERKGYEQVRRKGSHVRLYPPDFLPNARKVTVPRHRHLKVGTLLAIMKDAGLTVDDLR
jgi:predicted RNA binding protein YcfA (HicA-like mRNA interferase family)